MNQLCYSVRMKEKKVTRQNAFQNYANCMAPPGIICDGLLPGGCHA
jgi:hypothetical protein